MITWRKNTCQSAITGQSIYSASTPIGFAKIEKDKFARVWRISINGTGIEGGNGFRKTLTTAKRVIENMIIQAGKRP